MKRNLILPCLLMLLYFHLTAQCPTEDVIRFQTQEEVDAYVQQYANCTQLNEIEISGTVNNIQGLANLRKVNYLYINNCPQLGSLSGLHNIDTIEQNFGIYDSTGFNFFCEMEALRFIGRDFRVEGTKNLESLAGFKNLTTIGDDLTIEGNQQLENLEGLEAVIMEGSGSNISIQDNPRLSICCEIRHLLNVLPSANVIIQNNAMGCQNVDEITMDICVQEFAYCLAGTQDKTNLIMGTLFYPNPFYDAIHLNENMKEAIKNVAIYDASGRVVEPTCSMGSGSYNFSADLAFGLYLVVATTNNGNRYWQKVVKAQ